MKNKDDTIILGVCYNSTAEAAIVKNGRIVCAIGEERLNRVKNWFGIPMLSINWVLKEAGLSIDDIDYVSTHDGTKPLESRIPLFSEVAERISNSTEIDEARKEAQLKILWDKYNRVTYVVNTRHEEYIKQLESFGIKVMRTAHHLSHAASVYFTSGWNECFALTADGWGSDASNGLYQCKEGTIEMIAHSSIIDSLGYFYGSVTKHLGFTPHKHEGKVLGLAGHGNPEKLAPFFRKMVGFDKENRTFKGYMEKGFYVPLHDNPWLAEALRGEKREDVAAGAQRVLEEVVLEYVRTMIPPGSKLCLAGGIFANVLLNQKILLLPNVAEVYVYPNMGDGGLAVGSALYLYSMLKPFKSWRMDNVYWGAEYNDDEIKEVLEIFNLDYEYLPDIEKTVAEILADGNVVARFNGRMEYGPRALGNRSVLYRPDDPSVNDWLNKKLKRTEFMPFAPVTMIEHAADCYNLKKNVIRPAAFMTITCDCTDKMKKMSPGVVHVDGTARPQLIERSQNPSYYSILENFYKLTGNPTLINTSFNMHEEPIVCSPEDAVRAFLDAELPYLAIGHFLVKR